MKHFKVALTFALVLVVLILAFFGSVYLANKAKQKQALMQDDSRQYGSYLVENKDFGYKFDISDKYFAGYQEEQQGYTTSYYIPTKDPEWGQKYAKVLTIVAIPQAEVKEKEAVCKESSTVDQETPFDCIAFDSVIGKNKYYTFATLPLIEAGPTDLTAIGVDEGVEKALKKAQFYDPSSAPQNLKHEDLFVGYELTYTASLGQVFVDRADVEEFKGNIMLPRQMGEDFSYNFADRELFLLLPVEYCGLSGQCINQTLNFSINFGQTGATLSDLQKSELWKSLRKKPVAGNKSEANVVYSYEEGAEGEGIIYNFIITPNNEVFAVALKYLDEQVNTKYKTTPGFISFTKQKEIFENIVKSVSFQTSINNW